MTLNKITKTYLILYQYINMFQMNKNELKLFFKMQYCKFIYYLVSFTSKYVHD